MNFNKKRKRNPSISRVFIAREGPQLNVGFEHRVGARDENGLRGSGAASLILQIRASIQAQQIKSNKND